MRKKNMALASIFLFFIGCGGGQQAGWVPIDLDKPDQGRLLAFYLGGYVSKEGGDPTKAGILKEENGRFWLNPSVLKTHASDLAHKLQVETVSWDVLKDAVMATYYPARGFAPNLAAFKAKHPFETWFTVKANGSMTTAERHLFIEESAIRHALKNYTAQGEKLLYPSGTVIVGVHYEQETVLETTVMEKRADGFWDYYVYDKAGNLAPSTEARPQPLKAPIQCVGCHFGAKQFEPEKSFPNAAPPAPNGVTRKLQVEPLPEWAALTQKFQEHGKRSDTILAPYATLFMGELLRKKASLSMEDQALLAQFGF